jgi:hypothetical protein
VYVVDPKRLDLVEEFRRNPFGPHGPELTLLVNHLRLIPMEQRYIIVSTRRGREWAVAKMPTVRGAPVELGAAFDDYAAVVWEVFRLRWHAVTDRALDR